MSEYTRRRFVTAGALATGGVAAAAIGLPALGFALAPVFERADARWEQIGPPADFTKDTYVPRVISLVPDLGTVGKTTIFVRRRDPAVDREPGDRWNQFVAITSRCAHVGCPVNFVQAAGEFICPCHGGVYNFRGQRVGGPPPRPLDRFLTRVRGGQVEVGPRFSVNHAIERFAARDPSEPLDGWERFLYPGRFSTPRLPS
jgi:menaquinol-cytochrome c reductase iron-sulfur subunit